MENAGMNIARLNFFPMGRGEDGEARDGSGEENE
jgi:hypothetical protein